MDVLDMATIRQTGRITVTQKNFGWVHVEYKDVGGQKTIETNIRPKMWESITAEVDANKKYKTVEGVFYHTWRTDTKAGQYYSARRQVEGIAKVAYERGDSKLMKEVEEVLSKSDEAVYQWYQKWLKEHTNEQIEEFYNYEAVDESGLTKAMLEREF